MQYIKSVLCGVWVKVIGLTVDMHQGNEKSLNQSVQELKHGAENENNKSTLNKLSSGIISIKICCFKNSVIAFNN